MWQFWQDKTSEAAEIYRSLLPKADAAASDMSEEAAAVVTALQNLQACIGVGDALLAHLMSASIDKLRSELVLNK